MSEPVLPENKPKTSTGIDENLAGLLCYLLGFITGIVFLLIEKNSKVVKFHAMQSIIVFGGLFVLNLVLSFIPILGWLLGFVIYILSIVLWILLMIKAYQGQMYKVPIAGDIAEKQAEQFKV